MRPGTHRAHRNSRVWPSEISFRRRSGAAGAPGQPFAGSGALIVVEVLEVGIDDVVLVRARIGGLGLALCVVLAGLVDRLSQLHRGLGDVLDTALDLFGSDIFLL